MLLVIVERGSYGAERDRYPFQVLSGAKPLAAFAHVEGAEKFVSWCEGEQCQGNGE